MKRMIERELEKRWNKIAQDIEVLLIAIIHKKYGKKL